MNKLTNFFIALSIVAFGFTSCESMLDVDSDLIASLEDNQMNTPGDSIYNMMGIFSKVEKLAERYVILGELRADLMSTTSYSNPDLQDVSNLEISDDNPYNNLSDYYSVINHCNYLIKTVDTTIIAEAEKVMYKQFAAAKAIRAWTYMQIVLNYGKATYYEDPFLDVVDFNKELPVYTMEELFPILIADLLPWKDLKMPGGISLGEDITSEKLFFPIPILLGDMYLWLGDYENAAQEYYNLMDKFQYLVYGWYRNYWEIEGNVAVSRDVTWGYNTFRLGSNSEQLIQIAGSAEFGNGSPLDSLFWLVGNELSPSDAAILNWENETYYVTDRLRGEGDLRGDEASYYSPELFALSGNIPMEKGMIFKYYNMSTETTKAINIYRIGTLYLRYAEAVNRSGKPNLAFAVLKNGLSKNTLSVDSIVPRSEKYIRYDSISSAFYPYTDFTTERFNPDRYDITGIHARGCGNPDEAKDYIIPVLPSTEDSIQYVEDLIIHELALETAFEGNRFHDLMRIAIRRGDNAYIADKVAEKYTGNAEAIKSKLMIESNWYLP